MQETFIHPEVGQVVLATRAGLRRITLTVRRDGVVRLSYPAHVGKRRALAFLEEKREWLVRARARIEARSNARVPMADPAAIERLRRLAKQDLPLRIERLAAATGLRYAGLRISSAKTRWGSCSAKNKISLSLHLMSLPEHLRDFVILHELCHTVHHNHSPRFHALLNELLGGREQSLQRELRGYLSKQ